MIKLAVISGTDRPGSNALKVAEFVCEKYRALDVDAFVVNLCDFPVADTAGGQYSGDIPSIKQFNEKIISADGMVFVVPEYNGSYPGILKLFIDYLPYPRAFSKVPVSYIGESDGKFGALRSIEQLQHVCGYRYTFNFPERVFITKVSKMFDEDEGPDDDFTKRLLDSQVKNFIRFVDALNQADLTKKKVPE
ncbi:MAG: NAD(P)H-dependent oxidoreductase [Balneolales bacterium]